MIVSESNIETGQKHRQFTVLLTRINLPTGMDSSRIPHYLQGARFSLIGDIIYWLSPGKSLEMVFYGKFTVFFTFTFYF